MNLENLKSALKNEPAFRIKQCLKAVYSDFIESWDEASTLPKNLRECLSEISPLPINAKFFESSEKTSIKALLILEDDSKIETVLMRHEDGRNTVCVSSQVGCSMKCDFCATGKLGFKRNLTIDEIVNQVLVFERYLKSLEQRVTNVVYMGMGEPMLNFDNVIESIKILNDKNSFNIGARKISISTCGIIEGIKRLSEIPLQIKMAVSLHAPNNEIRSRIMPVNRSCDIDKLMNTLKNYIKTTGRKIMIEYILLNGVNDSASCAKELATLLKKNLGNIFMVNLIPYNETGNYKAPLNTAIINFKNVLKDEDVEVSQRFRFGHDIEGACGQLATKNS